MSIQGKKNRAWCFTSFDVTEENIQRILNISGLKYVVVGREIAPTTGTPHLQGYVEFTSQRHFNAVTKLLGNDTHVEARKGTAKEAAVYCKKEGDFQEQGVLSDKQGSRNDLHQVKTAIENGASMEEVIDIATNYQSLRTAQLLMPYKEPVRDWRPVVKWFHGVSGSGKTYTAFHAHPDLRVFVQTGSDRWWDGYDGHEVVILDDFRPVFCSFVRLLQLLDCYPCRIEYKGGSRQFRARYIYITSPEHPSFYYCDGVENISQLNRRISEVRHFGKKYVES